MMDISLYIMTSFYAVWRITNIISNDENCPKNSNAEIKRDSARAYPITT